MSEALAASEATAESADATASPTKKSPFSRSRSPSPKKHRSPSPVGILRSQVAQVLRPFEPTWGDPRMMPERSGPKEPLAVRTENGWEWQVPANPSEGAYISRNEMVRYYEAQTGLSLTPSTDRAGQPWSRPNDTAAPGHHAAATDRASHGRARSPPRSSSGARASGNAATASAQGGTSGRTPPKGHGARGNGREMAKLEDANGSGGWLGSFTGAPAPAPAMAPSGARRGHAAANESDAAPLLRGCASSDGAYAASPAGAPAPAPARGGRSTGTVKGGRGAAAAAAANEKKCCPCCVIC